MLAAITHPDEYDLPPLEAVWLALRTLRAINAPIPTATVTSLLSRYTTSDGLYSFDPGGDGSWGATSIAAKIFALTSEPPPPRTVSRLREAIAAETPPATIEELINEKISAWEAADELLPTRERTSHRSSVDQLVVYLEKWIDANHDFAAGELLGSVISLQEIAKSNGSAAPDIDLTAIWGKLRTPNGGYGATPGALFPDPHSTYDAIRLGAPADATGLEYFTLRARTDGWPTEQSQVDPCSTYMGALTDRAARDHEHDEALLGIAKRWVNELGGQSDTSEPTLCILALANMMGVEPPQALSDQIRAAVQDTTGGRPAVDLATEFRFLRLLVADENEALDLRPVPSELPRPPLTDMRLYEACSAYSDLVPLTPKCQVPATLRTPDGTYLQSSTAAVADLKSTALGWRFSSDIEARMKVLSRFRDEGETWMLPIGTTRNVNNLDSAFWALVLADIVHDPRYL